LWARLPQGEGLGTVPCGASRERLHGRLSNQALVRLSQRSSGFLLLDKAMKLGTVIIGNLDHFGTVRNLIPETEPAAVISVAAVAINNMRVAASGL
jgi:hypothetical protein